MKRWKKSKRSNTALLSSWKQGGYPNGYGTGHCTTHSGDPRSPCVNLHHTVGLHYGLTDFKNNKSIFLGVKWKLRNENESWVLQVLTYFLCLSQWHLQKWILKLLISTPLQSAAASLSAHTGLIYKIYRKLSTTYSDPKKLQLVGMSSRWNFFSWKGSEPSRAGALQFSSWNQADFF